MRKSKQLTETMANDNKVNTLNAKLHIFQVPSIISILPPDTKLLNANWFDELPGRLAKHRIYAVPTEYVFLNDQAWIQTQTDCDKYLLFDGTTGIPGPKAERHCNPMEALWDGLILMAAGKFNTVTEYRKHVIDVDEPLVHRGSYIRVLNHPNALWVTEDGEVTELPTDRIHYQLALCFGYTSYITNWLPRQSNG